MKNIIQKLSLALSLFAALNINAQSVTYKYVRNDPFDIKNFSGGIDALWCDLNSHSTAFGWGVRAEYMMGKSLLFNFDARFGFATLDYRKSNDNTTNYFAMEGGVGFIFANSTRTRNVPIVLSTQRVGNTQITTSIRGGVPAKVRLLVALRAGILQYNNSLDYSSFADSMENRVVFKDGNGEVRLKAANSASNSVFNYVTDIGAPSGSVTTQTIDKVGTINMTCIYAGLNFRSIRNLLIDVDGYGMRGNIRYMDFYIDAIIAPVLVLSDFSVEDNLGGAKVNKRTYSVEYTETTSLGWRMGFFMRKPKDQGFSWKIEWGSRPGFKSLENSSVPLNWKNVYFMATAGLYIPLKIKPMYTGENE
jgi:hypothetical protein